MWLISLFNSAILMIIVITYTSTSMPLVLSTSTSNDMEDLVRPLGYPLDTYEVQTSDGYILDLFRIRHGLTPMPLTEPRTPVLLAHGVMDSSTTWVQNGAQGLAFVLADAGHDVFLMNVRGNRYGLKHENLTSKDLDFWKFTFDEHAQYDVPACVDAVLKINGAYQNLHYIGHSQGTCQMFAAGSGLVPSLNEKIASFTALAPVAHIEHASSYLLQAIAKLYIDDLLKFTFNGAFLPDSNLLRKVLPYVCKETPKVCEFAIYAIAGLDQPDLDEARLPTYMKYYPSSTSVYNMIHWAQMIRSKKFQRYDYGNEASNILHYNSTTPPSYDLSLFNIPTFFAHGGKDALSDPSDVSELFATIPPRYQVKDLSLPNYAHLSFVWGDHSNSTVYPSVVHFVEQYPLTPDKRYHRGNGKLSKSPHIIGVVGGVIGAIVIVAGFSVAIVVMRKRSAYSRM